MKYVKLSALAALFSALTAVAQTSPKTVFIGDYLTQQWSSHQSNWVNKGAAYGTVAGTSAGVVARFQTDVVAQKPAIVHVMVGAEDARDNVAIPTVMSNLAVIVKQAQAAKIAVILATEPTNVSGAALLLPKINAGILAFGAANNIPVLNYADLVCECVNSIAPPYSTVNMAEDTTYPADGLIPSASGYGIMSTLAELQINVNGATLKYGWLSDEEISPTGAITPQVNTVAPGAVVQFTPMGTYSNGGEAQPLINENFAGQSGTWTSSNPEVMTINQSGQAWAITNGTSIIKYTSPNGVQFSEWIMYIQ
jgi:hypothetical protein